MKVWAWPRLSFMQSIFRKKIFTDKRTSLSDLLLVAPNPSKGTTTIYYDFGEHRGDKSLELYDYLGRRLFSITPQEREGQTTIDAEHYADGSYFIFMKVDGVIVKKTKLIVQVH